MEVQLVWMAPPGQEPPPWSFSINIPGEMVRFLLFNISSVKTTFDLICVI